MCVRHEVSIVIWIIWSFRRAYVSYRFILEQIPKWLRPQIHQNIFRSSKGQYSQLKSQLWVLSLGIEFLHPIHVQIMLIHHTKDQCWRIWGQVKSFPKWKVTYNFKFPKMASIWFTFNLTFQHQRSFKWNFVQHESWRSLSPISKKS